jgi:transposase
MWPPGKARSPGREGRAWLPRRRLHSCSPTTFVGLSAHLARGQRASHRLVQRARIIDLAADGVSTYAIARRLGCCEATVRKWRARMAASPRAPSMEDAARSGRPATIPIAVRLTVVRLGCDVPPEGERVRRFREVWTLASLRDAVAAETGVRISVSEVHAILRCGGLSPHRVVGWLHSPDAEFAARSKRVAELYVSPPPGAVVLSVDEKTGIQATRRIHPNHAGPRGHLRREFEYVRGGTTTMIAALNVATGRVHAVCKRRTRANFLAFLDRVIADYPKGDVYIVADNLNIHTGPEITAWCARYRRARSLRLHATPRLVAEPDRDLVQHLAAPRPPVRLLRRCEGAGAPPEGVRSLLQPIRGEALPLALPRRVPRPHGPARQAHGAGGLNAARFSSCGAEAAARREVLRGRRPRPAARAGPHPPARHDAPPTRDDRQGDRRRPVALRPPPSRHGSPVDPGDRRPQGPVEHDPRAWAHGRPPRLPRRPVRVGRGAQSPSCHYELRGRGTSPAAAEEGPTPNTPRRRPRLRRCTGTRRCATCVSSHHSTSTRCSRSAPYRGHVR